MTDQTPAFSSIADEAQYWKRKAEEYKSAAVEAKQELEEFQEGSRELELELEAQLGQQETKLKDLETINTRLKLENEQLRVKLDDSRFGRDEKRQIQNTSQISKMDDEIKRYCESIIQG